MAKSTFILTYFATLELKLSLPVQTQRMEARDVMNGTYISVQLEMKLTISSHASGYNYRL